MNIFITCFTYIYAVYASRIPTTSPPPGLAAFARSVLVLWPRRFFGEGINRVANQWSNHQPWTIFQETSVQLFLGCNLKSKMILNSIRTPTWAPFSPVHPWFHWCRFNQHMPRLMALQDQLKGRDLCLYGLTESAIPQGEQNSNISWSACRPCFLSVLLKSLFQSCLLFFFQWFTYSFVVYPMFFLFYSFLYSSYNIYLHIYTIYTIILYMLYILYILYIHSFVLFPFFLFRNLVLHQVALARHGHSSATPWGDEHKPHLPSVVPFGATPQRPPSSALPRMLFSRMVFVAQYITIWSVCTPVMCQF